MFRPPVDSIIFDLDGTLWDASPASAVACAKAASQLGINVSIDEAAIQKVSGLPVHECIQYLFGTSSHSVSDLYAVLSELEKKEIISSGGRFYDGMVDALRDLSQRYNLFLVSNCDEWYLNSFFDHSGLRTIFKDSLCFGQTQRPKSENIKEIIRRNQLNKAVYVGDTHWDQEAAFYAGAKFIFASYGFGSVNVSCPAVSSIDELVRLMKAGEPVPGIKIRKLTLEEFEMARSFYQSVGYFQAISSQDKFFAAFHDSDIVGLVRLAFESGHWVLRGMQVKPSYQFFGIGTRLIRLLEQDLGAETCYCLPHGWLDKFYGQIGFKRITPADPCPSFLLERLNENKKTYPHLILMIRAD